MQTEQTIKLVESLKQNSGFDVVFKKFVNEFFEYNYENKLSQFEQNVVNENDFINLCDMILSLTELWYGVSAKLPENICQNGLTYIVNRNYPKEFCEWFAEHITHNYMNDTFVSELFMDVLPSYYTQETYGLIRNIEYMKRMNKVFEQLETKLGKFRH